MRIKGSQALLLLALAFPACSFAEWTEEDTYRQAAFTMFAVVDWAQTREFVADGHRETNRLLGDDPSTSEIDTLIPLGIVTHYAIARMLPADYRKAWQYVFIGIEAQAVNHNYQVNMSFGF